MTKIRVLTESELLHRHQLTADPGYYVIEEAERVPATGSGASYIPVPNILEGPFTTEPHATHIAQTRYGMEAR